jgi:GNAT superfamily N-acetyltransferase
MQVRPAAASDVPSAAACIARAFMAEPVMAALFPGTPRTRRSAIARYSELLLRARLALGAPALVASDGGRLAGVVMGYGPRRPDWPPAIAAEWRAFVASVADLRTRFAEFDRATAPGLPAAPHHYLGAIAVDPPAQGTGIGRALMEGFCAIADADAASAGTALDTGNPANRAWYARFGFAETCSGPVGGVTVWGMFRPRPT